MQEIARTMIGKGQENGRKTVGKGRKKIGKGKETSRKRVGKWQVN